MSLIKNIETKMRITLWVGILNMVTAIVICAMCLSYANRMVIHERQQVYVLNKNIPLVARQTSQVKNRKAEYRAEIIRFHNLFFTLPPDNEYIEKNIHAALYLSDGSALAQYNTLKEKSFFSKLISTSSFITCTVDSVQIDLNTGRWKYWGKEKIQRPSDITIRNLVSQGRLQDITDAKGTPIRSNKNPYGCLLTHWQILENKDLSHEAIKAY
jgi:conjugative transposon TraK protein